MKTTPTVDLDVKDGAQGTEKKKALRKEREKIPKTSEYVMTRCEKCGELVPHGQYCISCGAPLSHITLLKLNAICPACGGRTAKGAFCVRCGSKQADCQTNAKENN